MAGGFGKRMMPLTKNLPKPMLKIKDKPLLESIITKFKENGFINFFISLFVSTGRPELSKVEFLIIFKFK